MNYESRIKNCVKVIFNENQRAVTPGQSAVFYAPAKASAKEGKGNEVLGGGVIM
jgi:tRNA U34 2-thiouridine synthase MnmA/TrmU